MLYVELTHSQNQYSLRRCLLNAFLFFSRWGHKGDNYSDTGGTLVLHSDNGGPMKGSTMLATLHKLGLVPSFSRPRVSDDNPFSEALFSTMKYHPHYPSGPFASVEQAQEWVDDFVDWYNTKHLHSAIRFITPDDRHYGREQEILNRRKLVYELARLRNPTRWSGHIRNLEPVHKVWLNPHDRQEDYHTHCGLDEAA